MLMVYSRDRKTPYRSFFDLWFKFINDVKKNGLPYHDDNDHAIKPDQGSTRCFKHTKITEHWWSMQGV